MQFCLSVFQHWYVYVGVDTSSKFPYIIMQFDTTREQRIQPLYRYSV